MNKLVQLKVKDISNFQFKQNGQVNIVKIGDMWHGKERKFYGLNSKSKEALIMIINGWIHCYYNSVDSLTTLIKLIPKNINPKFAALPKSQWDIVKEKWPKLDFINHEIYEYLLNNKQNNFTQVKFKDLTLNELAIVLDKQPYIEEFGTKEYVKSRILSGFTCSAFYNNNLVGWEIMNDDNTLGFLRVIDGFKNRGIGTYLHKYLSLKVKNSNLKSICFISKYNQSRFGNRI